MITLNAGLSRKVGEPNYGSRGATVNLQLEVESNLVNDPEALMSRIRRLFQLARQAVDEELTQNAQNTPTQSRGAGQGNGYRPATTAQLRAIRALANQLVRQRYEVSNFSAVLRRLSYEASLRA